MNADIEALILSGDFFNGGSRSSSPPRSPSPDHDSDHGWHDEELAAQEKGLDYDSDTARRDAAKRLDAQQQQQQESIGMGPGRTGVKGVIRDRDEAAEIQRDKRLRDAEELRAKMEATNLGGKTFLEEEREKAGRGEKADDLVMREFDRMRERRDVFGQKREAKFGHLREVGLKGFLSAVEQEDKGVWVVVHLYDSSLERCYLVDETLAKLARTYPDTKFLRARAATLGFASRNSSNKSKPLKSRLNSVREDDDDDPYAYDDKDYDEDDEDAYEEDEVDLDMLPTMLVYRNGELVHNWVRVDWEAGDAGLEEFLDKHHVLPASGGRKDNLGFPSDEEDFDLLWSDEDDDVVHTFKT
ncbi:Phosducin-like protein 2 [Psilocybe cubensis]|uniref:Phosducin-like protein 2 n=2 Tax=Psilocybe cubensis TaxID=181762 RepID=A0ACB8H8Z6_PSICU|nr:Phosducin-like protein 2 [Psilocybe cubensis]KAH9484386.1 Phosducin-like protein 2 [Psilocybe cubensis]